MNLFPQGCRMSQAYGVSPEMYRVLHPGIDLVPLSADKRCYNKWSGKVVEVHEQDDNACGKYIVVQHKHLSIQVKYGHFESISCKVGPIEEGEELGVIGLTGRTTGLHLHLEVVLISKYGYPLGLATPMKGRVDPLPWFHDDVTKFNGWYGIK